MPLIEPKCLVLADNTQPIGRLVDVSNASCKNINCAVMLSSRFIVLSSLRCLCRQDKKEGNG
jgi:hypothetical protein